MGDDFYCVKHRRKKVWMMQNSFCPDCDNEKTGVEVSIICLCEIAIPDENSNCKLCKGTVLELYE